jgi:hypothetical protein
MDVHPYVERFRGDAWAQEFIREGRAQGHEQGQAQGWEQGQAQGWEQGQAQGLLQGGERVLLALIRARFGKFPSDSAVAKVLSGWEDVVSAVAMINSTADPAELLSRVRLPKPSTMDSAEVNSGGQMKPGIDSQA